MKKEIERKIIEKEPYTEVDYPFLVKPNFSSRGSIIEISTQGPVITFVLDDSMGDLLGFNKTTIIEENNLSPIPACVLSFDNIFLKCNIAQGKNFKSKLSGIIHNFTMDVDPGYKHKEKFRGGVD